MSSVRFARSATKRCLLNPTRGGCHITAPKGLASAILLGGRRLHGICADTTPNAHAFARTRRHIHSTRSSCSEGKGTVETEPKAEIHDERTAATEENSAEISAEKKVRNRKGYKNRVIPENTKLRAVMSYVQEELEEKEIMEKLKTTYADNIQYLPVRIQRKLRVNADKTDRVWAFFNTQEDRDAFLKMFAEDPAGHGIFHWRAHVSEDIPQSTPKTYEEKFGHTARFPSEVRSEYDEPAGMIEAFDRLVAGDSFDRIIDDMGLEMPEEAEARFQEWERQVLEFNDNIEENLLTREQKLAWNIPPLLVPPNKRAKVERLKKLEADLIAAEVHPLLIEARLENKKLSRRRLRFLEREEGLQTVTEEKAKENTKDKAADASSEDVTTAASTDSTPEPSDYDFEPEKETEEEMRKRLGVDHTGMPTRQNKASNLREWVCGKWQTTLLYTDAVQKIVPTGQILSYRALIIIGNGNGTIGFGMGKAADVSEARVRALREAKSKLHYVHRYKNSALTSDLYGTHNNIKVYIQKRPVGWGLRAGGPVKHILESAGVTDCTAKAYGSSNRNPYSVVRATFNALLSHESLHDIALRTGKRVHTLHKVFVGKEHMEDPRYL